MTTVLPKGVYKLVESKAHNQILMLDQDTFVWIAAKGIGEILVASHKLHKTDHILATGVYRLYNVEDEPKLSDQVHLELNVGNHVWQGYLLPTGLPTATKKRARIIPTTEVISSRQGDLSARALNNLSKLLKIADWRE